MAITEKTWHSDAMLINYKPGLLEKYFWAFTVIGWTDRVFAGIIKLIGLFIVNQ